VEEVEFMSGMTINGVPERLQKDFVGAPDGHVVIVERGRDFTGAKANAASA
jgi:hypothetical protein